MQSCLGHTCRDLLPHNEVMVTPICALVDMDSFFASVEVADNPHLSGKPVIVGADPLLGKGRGVVSTCSYEARAFGIHSAMPVRDAYSLCPGAVFLPVRLSRYQVVSGEVMEIIRSIAPVCIPQSIDEALVIIPGSIGYRGAETLARRIRMEIRRRTSLSCSVGVGQSRVVAKIASSRCKPDGLMVIPPEMTGRFLSPLPVREIPGVGDKTTQFLAAHGILTIGDLIRCEQPALTSLLGNTGSQLFLMARGLDPEDSPNSQVSRSIGRETTFQEDVTDPAVLFTVMDSLSKEASEVLRDERFACRTVGIKVRYTGFITRSKACSMLAPTDDPGVIAATARDLLLRMRWDQGVRLVGIRLSGLLIPDTRQSTLLEFSRL